MAFTDHAAKRLDARLNVSASKLEELMRRQHLSFEPGKDISLPGIGTLIIDKNGNCTTVLSDNMAHVRRANR